MRVRGFRSAIATLLGIALLSVGDAADRPSTGTTAVGSFRIVSLNPSITRLLIDLDLASSIVGTVSVPGVPRPQALPAGAEIVGSYAKPQIEKIAALKPTHVLLIREGEDRISSQLQKLGPKVQILEGRFLRDFEPLVRGLGETFSQSPEKLEALLQKWRTDWAAVDQLRGKSGGPRSDPPVRRHALLMLQVDPVYIAGEDTFLSEVLEKCGWKNAYPGQGYPRLGREQLELMTLDRIVYFSMLGQDAEEKALKQFWAKSVKHRAVPLVIETHPHLAQLGFDLPRLTLSFCQKLGAAWP